MAGDQISLALFELDSQALSAAASGAYSIADQAGMVSLDLSAPDLAPVASSYDLAAQGALTAGLEVVMAGEAVEANFDATAQRLALATVSADRLTLQGRAAQTGGEASFDLTGVATTLMLDKVPTELTTRADLSLSGQMANDVLRLEHLELEAPLLRAGASGQYDLNQGNLAVEYTLSSAELTPVAAAYNASLGGVLDASGEAKGPAEALRLEGQIALGEAQFEAIELGDLRLIHQIMAAPAPEGQVTLTKTGGQFGNGAIETGFRLNADLLSLTGVMADMLGIRLEGQADMDIAASLVNGAFRIDVAELARVGELVGTDLSGRAEGQATLRTTEGRQDMAVELSLGDLAVAGVRMATAKVQAGGSDLLADPAIDLAARADRLTAEGVSLDQVRLKTTGPLAALEISAMAAGALLDGKPLNLDLAGRGRCVGRSHRLDGGAAAPDGGRRSDRPAPTSAPELER